MKESRENSGRRRARKIGKLNGGVEIPAERTTGKREDHKWYGRRIKDRYFVYENLGENFEDVFSALRSGETVQLAMVETAELPDLRNLLIRYGEFRLKQEFAEDQYIRKFYALIPELNKSLNLILEKVANFGLITGLKYGNNDPCTFFKGLRGLDVPEHVSAVLEIIADTADSICRLKTTTLEFLSERARQAMPNTCELVGEEVALELLHSAGSLRNLALMPASAIQVLGAEKALFKHFMQGTPPPKHGVIFKVKGMSSLKTKERGKVSRFIAAKAAIALRADYAGTRIDTEKMKNQLNALMKRKK